MKRHDSNPVQIAVAGLLAVILFIIVSILTMDTETDVRAYAVENTSSGAVDTIQATSRRSALMRYMDIYDVQPESVRYVDVRSINK